MTNKHTPGPWEISHEQKNIGFEIFCFVGDDHYNVGPARLIRERADAHLIAASPTLYQYALDQANNGCEKAKTMLASLGIND